MLLAAAAGHTAIVRTLLNQGAQPDASWAMKTKLTTDTGDIVSDLIERTYQLGWTPLMVACQNGHQEIVRVLLQAGANTEPRSPLSKNSLEIAKENGRAEILKILEEHSNSAQSSQP